MWHFFLVQAYISLQKRWRLMKRLGATIFILLIGYIIFYDIKIGTLPLLRSNQSKQVVTNSSSTIPYESIEVKNGDTVLSIVEEVNNNQIPSIEKIVADFKELNPDQSPGKLKVGKSYKFPVYKAPLRKTSMDHVLLSKV